MALFYLYPDHTCRLVDCDGEVSQWSSDDLKKYCVLKDATHISCLEVTLMYRVMACNVPGSYGYSNEIFPASIWVRNDCYAQFKVCYTSGLYNVVSLDISMRCFPIDDLLYVYDHEETVLLCVNYSDTEERYVECYLRYI
jgi:hypothetical protein